MLKNERKGRSAKVAPYDPVWEVIRDEARDIAQREPELTAFVYATVLNQRTLEQAVCHRLASRLGHEDVNSDLIRQIFNGVIETNPELGVVFRADLSAVYDRDPACSRLIDPLLYFKGFHALETQRFAHALWQQGRLDFAMYLQSQSSRVFGIDIHPAAKIGRGIMFDHGSGIVIGETAEIGDNTSLLHSVTLGGSGKETGDRHPKIGRGVMIGAGSKILGNIHVGDCARIAAGSVVLKDVPPKTTVAGVPARVVGEAGCAQPSRMMDQALNGNCGCYEESAEQTGRS
ncbi:serine O-acetyltransferase [Rhodomicrobium vannielii ATCC 17100]|uniref:Serine acetyltransferase n=1 Tax=Rhodomicrobium vannielii (strain ATCC 17100 / DSM 162 / LMG 4299 / NCIMB 10020 / ATH 3.1.1) TaxID=648757 RepID=E3I312_RHOVT|nr:serine O-acetyltransferase [Rhodomicrobium vannielii]ADP70306.1 serine O-acetyltransferase [Rhodomicrobium vannielii ATCC 17100]